MDQPNDIKLEHLQILQWPQIAAELEVSMDECQSFLRYFRDQPGYFHTQPTVKVPHGTLIKWASLKEVVEEIHSESGVMPVEVQLIWGHLDEIVRPDADYVWFHNWNNKGPR